MNRYVKLVLLYGIVVPVAFVWDVFFTVIDYVHKGCTWVDKKGEAIIDDLQDELRK